MSDSHLTTVRVASTPIQAKLFVAMLQAEGIPAFVEGDSLADEVAVSRRLMNVAGTHVRVRAEDLEQAREVLADVAIDDAELEAQAMATPVADETSPANESSPMPLWIFALLGLAVVGALAWKIWG